MRALECLVAVVEQGSLTRAATMLHISQPALSHQIAALEEEVGTAVIERLPRGIRPTAAGIAATAEARIALAAAGRALTEGRRVAAGYAGQVRIACAETMAAWVLAPLLDGWRRQFPGVKLDLREYASTERMMDTLLAGMTDVAVGPRPASADGRIEVLGREEIVAVSSPGHRFARLDAVPLAELAGESLVHYHPDDGFAVRVGQLAAERGLSLPEPALCTGSPHTAAQLAAGGLGVALVPVSALIPAPDATIRPLDPAASREVVMITAVRQDDLLNRFTRDLKRQGLPEWRISQPRQPLPRPSHARMGMLPYGPHPTPPLEPADRHRPQLLGR
jgi:DNA-binding transcriptional LysR family regulator